MKSNIIQTTIAVLFIGFIIWGSYAYKSDEPEDREPIDPKLEAKINSVLAKHHRLVYDTYRTNEKDTIHVNDSVLTIFSVHVDTIIVKNNQQ